MNKSVAIFLILVLSLSFCYSQIPVEKFREDIEKLETEELISDYWNNLHKIDQEILVNTSDLKIADSISISNMIKTILIFDIHKTKGYNPNGFSGFVPILNLSHNHIGQSQIAYWSVIEKCAKIGGAIDSFGGKYPAYQLESVALTFYNYSLFNQEEKFEILLKKMNETKIVNIIDELLNSFKYQNELRKLNEIKVLTQWYLQPLKNHKEQDKFSFVKMSDDNLYIKKYGRIQKLELVETNKNSKTYQIENEPFGWYYVYKNDESLSLIDDKKNELIEYTIAK